MKILVKKINKKSVHLLKSEDNGKKKKKLGSFSKQEGNNYLYLNFRDFYSYVRGGAKFHENNTYLRFLGNLDFFYPMYLYEKTKRENEKGQDS